MSVRVHVAAVGSGVDGDQNLAMARGVVARAADDGARLVVLPEYASRFDPRGVGADLAEPIDGPFVSGVREAARTHGVVVVAGTLVPGATSARAVNVVVVVDGEGRLVHTYRKVHLYDAFGHRESDTLEAGPVDADTGIVDVEGLRLGVMTCYDLRFPESARRLMDGGATVLAVPAAWAAGEHKADHWRTLIRARAIENTVYVLGAAQQGRGVAGASMVVDPLGVVTAESDRADVPAVGELDPALVDTVRERNPSLLNRRYAVVPRD